EAARGPLRLSPRGGVPAGLGQARGSAGEPGRAPGPQVAEATPGEARGGEAGFQRDVGPGRGTAMNARRMHPAARTARAALAGLLWCALSSGCGMHVLGHRSDPVTRPEEPKLTDLQHQLLEASQQAALAPREPYWPYRMGQIYLEA